MDEEIGLFRPVVAEEAVDAAMAVLRGGWLGPGPVVEQFEAAFAAYVGAPHAVAVSSGSAALRLALTLAGVGPGDEVLTSPITFVGANEVVLHCGATPVFVDVDADRGLMRVDAAAAAIGPRTRAILVTHLSGTPVDLDQFLALADRAGVTLVEDAAHACGASYRGTRIGGHPGFQAFSFQATKNLNAVDGGMLCLRSADDAARARRLRWMGIDHDTWSRASGDRYRWSYEVTEVGHKFAMNDVNAAIGLAHLPLLDGGNDRRRDIADRYRAGLAGVGGIGVIEPLSDRVSATYLAPVLADDRDALAAGLAQRGIATGVHFRRNDVHAIFGPARDLPGAEAYWTRTLSLPVHLALTEPQVEAVIDAVIDASQTALPAGR